MPAFGRTWPPTIDLTHTMRYDTILEEISATPLYLFLVFVVVLAAMHLALVRRRSLSDIAWKHMDYVWLAAAALGL